jgi:hypothetical protein
MRLLSSCGKEQGAVAGTSEQANDNSGPIKGTEFLDSVRDC